MSFFVVIPARYASKRLPGKPLLTIAGKPMVQHVYERAQASDAQQVIVATDVQRIADAVKQFGGEVCMTSSQHLSGTDRIQEVAQHYQLDNDHIIVNVQGDEPLIPPAVINQVARNLQQVEQASAATLATTIPSQEELSNPNAVKVVTDSQQLALYFSRSPVPYYRDVDSDILLRQPEQYNLHYRRHLGIYAYRVALLNQFVHWEPAPLEKIEALEQLRILFYGQKIHVDIACEPVPAGVDTPEDLDKIQAIIAAQQ